MDNGISLSDQALHETEERLQAQKELQMLDLGTGRREYVTTVDKPLPRELRQSKKELLRSRIVNQEGTEAARWYQQNKQALNAWNNIGDAIAEDSADKEQLQDIMGGQSHRARLNKEIQQQGGQGYGESSAIGKDPGARRGRAASPNGGMFASGGHGILTHIPSSAKPKNPGGMASPLTVPFAPKGNRPLDPAVDPNRPYGYKGRRGGKRTTISYEDELAHTISPSRGRNTSEKTQASMVGSTVRLGPAGPPQTKAKRPDNDAPARPSRLVLPIVPLNDQAFLKALNDMKGSKAFHDYIPDKPKPSPTSKGTAPLARPVETSGTTSFGKKKADETHAKSDARLGEQSQSCILGPEKSLDPSGRKAPNSPKRQVSRVPTVTRSGVKEDQIGTNTAQTTRGSMSTVFDLAVTRAEDLGADRSKENPSDGTILCGAASNDPQSTVRSEPHSGNDLIMFDDNGDRLQTSQQVLDKTDRKASLANSMLSPSAPDIMDQEVKGEIPQASLTPCLVAPRTITYRGVRYIRADQVGDQTPENGSDWRLTSPHKATPEKVRINAELKTGLQALQESSANPSILGNHNRREMSNGSPGASPRLPSGDAVPAIVKLGSSESRERTQPQPPGQATSPEHFQGDMPSPASRARNSKLANTFSESAAPPRKAAVASPAASKYAAPDDTFGKSTLQREQPVTLPAALETYISGQVQEHTAFPQTTTRGCQDDTTSQSKSFDIFRSMRSSSLSETASSPMKRAIGEVDKQTKTTPASSSNAPNLSASKWGNHDTAVVTSLGQKRTNAVAGIKDPFKLGPVAEDATIKATLCDAGNPEGGPVHVKLHPALQGKTAANAKAAPLDPCAPVYAATTTKRLENDEKAYPGAQWREIDVTPTTSAPLVPSHGPVQEHLKTIGNPERSQSALRPSKTGLTASKYAATDDSTSIESSSTTSTQSKFKFKLPTMLPVGSKTHDPGKHLGLIQERLGHFDSSSQGSGL